MILLSSVVQAAPQHEDTLSFGAFGDIHVYMPQAQPKHVVIFVSGDGGWNLGVIDMARALAGLDALVAGVDITAYLRKLESGAKNCGYPAADFEELSQFLQKHYAFPKYITPLLVGYSSGATLVYTILAQGPPNTFLGGVSLGFCPDLPLRKPLCRGNGLKFTAGPNGKGYTFLPDPDLKTPWIAFQGEIDQVCNADVTSHFTAQINNAKIVKLPKVGHGFSVPKNWMPQFKESFTGLTAVSGPSQTIHSSGLENLPLIEVPVDRPGGTFAVIISGDGGWAGIDKSLAEALAAAGIPCIGLDSLRYFWTRRTPDEAGRALSDILRYYFTAWHRDSVMLIGYSLGAEVLPFMASRLPPDLMTRTSLIALLGPGRSVDFEFRVADWLPGNSKDTLYPVKPEIENLIGKNLLCVYGTDETAPLCPDLDPKHYKLMQLPGGHHFGGDYQTLVRRLLSEAHY